MDDTLNSSGLGENSHPPIYETDRRGGRPRTQPTPSTRGQPPGGDPVHLGQKNLDTVVQLRQQPLLFLDIQNDFAKVTFFFTTNILF